MPSRICVESDVPTVVDILVDSFYADPTWSWIFPDPDRRRDQQRFVWQALTDGAMRHSSVWLSDRGTSTAVWAPPGAEELSEVQANVLRAELAELVGDDAPRVLGALEAFEHAGPTHEPYYLLSLLGTASSDRGHGYGLQLLADSLVVVDEADQPAYLEATHPVNVGLYQRYGFELFGSFTLPYGGPEVPTMWRPRRSERRE